MYLIDPIGKRSAYGVNYTDYDTPYLDLPPWTGPIRRPVYPDSDGHFDHIPVGTPEFAEAHVFGSIRFVLDVWEKYLGRRVEWHFARDYDRLEIVILPGLDNAHAGYGYMEIGAHHRRDGSQIPFALNFDVIAHELGHLIIYGTIGVPTPAAQQGEYFGFHESAADITALIAVLHFESLIRHLLEETSGNLYTFNELDRFAELSPNEQIRLASNSVKLSEFAAGWEDEHALSQPLTGAIFDILIDIFQEALVARGLIPHAVAELTRSVRDEPERAAAIQPVFDAAFSDQREAFRAALIEARDYMGIVLAGTWKRLSPDFFRYAEVAQTLIAADQLMSGGRYRRAMIESFEWRQIGRVRVGPRLRPPNARSHIYSARTMVPEMRVRLPRMSYREEALLAGIVR